MEASQLSLALSRLVAVAEVGLMKRSLVVLAVALGEPMQLHMARA
jgi:hypothetical protein